MASRIMPSNPDNNLNNGSGRELLTQNSNTEKSPDYGIKTEVPVVINKESLPTHNVVKRKEATEVVKDRTPVAFDIDNAASSGDKDLTDVEIPKPEMIKRNTIEVRTTSTGDKILTLMPEDDSELESSKTKPKRKCGGKCCKGEEEAEVLDDPNQATEELKRDFLDRALYKAGYNLRDIEVRDLLTDLSVKYQKCMFIATTYTIQNFFGTPGPNDAGPQKLSQLLNRLIPMGADARLECLAKSRDIRPPLYLLVVNVIGASGLKATDPNGFSDPFCKIWVKGKKSHAKKTDIMERTVNPVWKETFRFHVSDMRNDVLKIEIWDSDPLGLAENLAQVKQIRSMRGCWLFCTDFFESLCSCGGGSVDDFIGQTRIEVGKLYSEGIDQWLPLKTVKGKDEQGEIHIAAKIEVTKPKYTYAALKRHFLLVKLCLQYGIKNKEHSEESFSQWEHILKHSTRTLIFQHAVQANIRVFEDLLCKFIILVHLASQDIPFDFQFLFTALTETNEALDQFQATDYSFDNPLQEIYRETLENLQRMCLEVLKKLHSFDVTEDTSKRVELEFILRCVNLCQSILGASSDLWPTLKTEAQLWFNHKAVEINETPIENRTEHISNFLKFLKRYHIALDNVLKSVFSGKTYTQITYESLENSLCEPLKWQMNEIATESLNSSTGTQTKKKEDAVQVFAHMKETIEYISRTLSLSISQMQLGQFYAWFGINTMEDWFVWKQDIVVAEIEFVASRDDLENKLVEVAGRYEKQSTSVKKTSDLIQKEICGLWRLVSHPDLANCNSFFIWGLHNCCMKYADSLIELIDSRNLVDTFKTGGKKKLCVIANNLWSLAMFAAKTISRTVVKLHQDSPDTKYSLQLLCVILCADLSEEIRGEMFDYIDKVVEAKNRKQQERAIREYAGYMHKTLTVEANQDMAFEIYLLFQDNVWIRVVDEVARQKSVFRIPEVTCLNKIQKCLGRACNKIEGLRSLLKETEKLCYLDENGKLKEILWNEDYKILKKELDKMLELSR